jgi:hypothetical protein
MLKKTIPITPANAGKKCGDCIHFNRIAKFEKVCKLLGTKHFAQAPYCYKVDPYILTPVNPDILNQIALLTLSFTPQQTRVYVQLMKENSQLEKIYKVKFGQPVVFRLGGGEYLSNYFKGFVLGGATAGEAQLYVTSDLGKTQRANPAMLTLMPDSVYTLSAWKKKKTQLLKDPKKLKDPNPLYSAHVEKKDMFPDYVPPTLENAPAEWLDKRENKGVMKSKKSLKKEKDGTLTFKV